MAGLKAFREAYLSTGADATIDVGAFGDIAARQLRYAVLWAYFESDAYSKVHTWSTAYRASYGLYKHIRGVYNPAQRLGTFWETHLQGGALDPAAGDGTTEPSALPILTDNQALRQAIAQLWRDSNWQVNKDIYALRGAVLGDTAIRVVDDVSRQRVYLEVLHPGLLADVTRDPFGNVKTYRIEEQRPDPRGARNQVTYTETATRDGDLVVYQTLLNGAPYPWNGVAAEWSEPYGFTPLVAVKHRDVGLDWGWSELHPALAKIRESDDLASALDDQIRKLVNAPWLFSGVENPNKTPRTSGATPTQQRPEPGREELPALYGPTGATATPLVAPLDIAATSDQVQRILASLEADYPELSFEKLRLSGAASGQALRIARQPAEGKVQQRRAPYDSGLVRAHQMAIAIGGWRGYPGYQGFSLDSYRAGALDHRIGGRAVFGSDPIDQLEERQLFWQVAKVATDAGVTLESYLEDAGWTPERIRRAIAAQPAPSTPQGDRING
jgi:hypothetical protein